MQSKQEQCHVILATTWVTLDTLEKYEQPIRDLIKKAIYRNRSMDHRLQDNIKAKDQR